MIEKIGKPKNKRVTVIIDGTGQRVVVQEGKERQEYEGKQPLLKDQAILEGEVTKDLDD